MKIYEIDANGNALILLKVDGEHIEVLDGSESNYMGVCSGYTLYDKLINCIEWLIKEGYFNKEYLI